MHMPYAQNLALLGAQVLGAVACGLAVAHPRLLSAVLQYYAELDIRAMLLLDTDMKELKFPTRVQVLSDPMIMPFCVNGPVTAAGQTTHLCLL